MEDTDKIIKQMGEASKHTAKMMVKGNIFLLEQILALDPDEYQAAILEVLKYLKSELVKLKTK